MTNIIHDRRDPHDRRVTHDRREEEEDNFYTDQRKEERRSDKDRRQLTRRTQHDRRVQTVTVTNDRRKSSRRFTDAVEFQEALSVKSEEVNLEALPDWVSGTLQEAEKRRAEQPALSPPPVDMTGSENKEKHFDVWVITVTLIILLCFMGAGYIFYFT